MKIAIVTFYNSTNYGAFLQANALRVFLSNYGEVFFIKTKVRNIWKKLFKLTVKALIKFQFRRCLLEWRKSLSCYKNVKTFKTIVMNEKSLKDIDLIVFGSDELWNIEKKLCKFPLLWGKGFEKNEKISYAVSMNNSTEKSLYENFSPHNYLKTFKKLSVRDKHSQEIIQKVTGREVSLVLDPTFLLEPRAYMSMIPKINLSDYIAVYSFGINDKVAGMLRGIAKEQGKELVSFAKWFNWCDRNIAVQNPFAYYMNADFVVTSTFHGVALAIHMKKQFAVFTNGRIKVLNLLQEFNLTDRIADGLSVSALQNLFQSKIDYSLVENILKEKRQESLDFLKSVLMFKKDTK